MSTRAAHILLVEDDASLAEWIQRYLETQGFRVSHCARGDTALDALKQLQPHLVILDVLLPYKNGFEICRAAREFYRQPILMLTACSEELDEINGLEQGANDYLAKPVRPRVLLARINALLRHELAETRAQVKTLEFGLLQLSLVAQSAVLAGEPVALTSNEFDVLWLLASRAGEVLSREYLVKQLRGIEYDGLDRSIDIRISRLRKKLQDNTGNPFRIKSIRAQGYLFVADAWSDA